MSHVPTVESLLAQTSIGNGLHDWRADGGSIRVTRAVLRQALEAAYDSTMPDWPGMVELDDA